MKNSILFVTRLWLVLLHAIQIHRSREGDRMLQSFLRRSYSKLTPMKIPLMKPAFGLFVAMLLVPLAGLHAGEFHVATDGNDSNRGTKNAPLRTIQQAANLAQPGDVVTVHAGLYRERVNPPRGGSSDKKRIVYQAAPGQKVEIKGSEVVKGWEKVGNDTWKVTLPNSFFDNFNPFGDLMHGEWFDAKGREHHTGAVYLNNEWLAEAAKLEDVLSPFGAVQPAFCQPTHPWRLPNPGLWFAKVEGEQTSIWAQFPGVEPNRETVEINVRQSVFYPDQPGRNYITVRGFIMRHAATPWAGAMSEQVGLIGTHWSKGWIIEDNAVTHSTCTGITLGRHEWHDGAKPPATAPGFVCSIEAALREGWSREKIGGHIVRNNHVSHCEKNAIHGSLGGVFSKITGNTIHDIHVRRLFGGADQAGVKFLAPIDVEISRNHIYRTCLGLWLDWMAQGTRVSQNLFHDNSPQDMFIEVNHGPFVIDNNLFLSRWSLVDVSEGGAYVHNLFLGWISSMQEPKRETPYHPAHSTALAGLRAVRGGDNRFYNNIFVAGGNVPKTSAKKDDRHGPVSGYGLRVYDTRDFPLMTGGNVYLGNEPRPYAKESDPLVLAGCNPNVKLVEHTDHTEVRLSLPEQIGQLPTTLVTTKLLGKAQISGCVYERADGSPLKIDTDYFGKKRNGTNPFPGPFESAAQGIKTFKVWPPAFTQ